MSSKFNLSIETTNFFESLFKNSSNNAIIIMDFEGFILDINPGLEKYFGYKNEDLVGKFFGVLFSEDDKRILKPEIELESVHAEGYGNDENYILHKNGEPIWVAGESVLLENDQGRKYVIKIIHDINKQKLLENHLKENNYFVENILDTANEGLVVLDNKMRIIKANNAFYKIFKTNQEINGLHLYELENAKWRDPQFRNELEEITSKNYFIVNKEIEFEIPGEGIKVISITSKFIQQPHGNMATLLVVNDVTSIREKDQRKNDFISFVSHELRTPLTNIKAYSELMERTLNNENIDDTKKYLGKTKQFISRLEILINELHDTTKAASGKIQIGKAEFLFEDLLNDTVETTLQSYPEFDIEIEGNAHVVVNGDRFRINQVLTNYLSNAIKYSGNSRKIVVRSSTENNNLIVAVVDFGLGLPKEKLTDVFKRLYRLDDHSEIEGLGMGLYLAKEIITAHKGKVWVESAHSKGSTFYFSVPLA